MYGQEGQSAADATFDSTPLPGEREHGGAVFPESRADSDTIAENAARIAASRAAIHQRRYNAWYWTLIRILGNIFLSAHWKEIPPDERHPRFVVFIGNNWKRWVARAMFYGGILWWLHFFVTWFFVPNVAVLHDGRVVNNLWNPVRVQEYDLSSLEVAAWIDEHRSNIPVIAPAAEFVTADVYEDGQRHNVTIKWLEEALERACADELDKTIRPKSPQVCVCYPAVEIGILADVIFIDDELMFNARVDNSDGGTTRVKYSDGTEREMPIAILVSYTRRNGQQARKFFDDQKAYCVKRSIDLVSSRVV